MQVKEAIKKHQLKNDENDNNKNNNTITITTKIGKIYSIAIKLFKRILFDCTISLLIVLYIQHSLGIIDLDNLLLEAGRYAPSQSNKICRLNDVIHQVHKDDMHKMTIREREAKAETFLNTASSFSGANGEGLYGWLFLLAAYDMNPLDESILENLIDNYVNSGYTEFAFDELLKIIRTYPRNEKTQVAHKFLDNLRKEKKEAYISSLKNYNIKRDDSSLIHTAGEPTISVLFPTLLWQWNLLEQIPRLDVLNQGFYDATILAYENLKKRKYAQNNTVTDTELNHDFFQWQMDILRTTGNYWDGYTKLDLFEELKNVFIDAATQFLIGHGHHEEVAHAKARHSTIIWASVHTSDSYHEPHMTEDSLCGGVYYVSVPKNSGKLGVFDPRGMNPVLKPPVQNLEFDQSMPPFHRKVSISPEDGLLVLFPGWAIHHVEKASGSYPYGKYRVSVSVNLKGEWQDTVPIVYEAHSSKPSPSSGNNINNNGNENVENLNSMEEALNSGYHNEL